MAENVLSSLLFSITVILGIIGVLYMLKDVMIGITLVLVCGFLIFIRAFVNKYSG